MLPHSPLVRMFCAHAPNHFVFLLCYFFSVPDENYARELMQLFTIGLVELNLDGSAKRDDMGVAIKTYNSHDIVSFARAWTGFDYYTR